MFECTEKAPGARGYVLEVGISEPYAGKGQVANTIASFISDLSERL
jgi:hypothetical protein